MLVTMGSLWKLRQRYLDQMERRGRRLQMLRREQRRRLVVRSAPRPNSLRNGREDLEQAANPLNNQHRNGSGTERRLTNTELAALLFLERQRRNNRQSNGDNDLIQSPQLTASNTYNITTQNSNRSILPPYVEILSPTSEQYEEIMVEEVGVPPGYTE